MSAPEDLILTTVCPYCEGALTARLVVTWQGRPYYRLVDPTHDGCLPGGERGYGNLWPSTALR